VGDADAVTVGDTVTVEDTVAVAESVGEAVALADEVADGLVPAVGVAPLLAVALELADPVAGDVKMAGADEDGEFEQAESAMEASTAKAPQTAASLVLSTAPAMVVRTFMEPPRGPGRWRPCSGSGVRSVSGSRPRKPPAEGNISQARSRAAPPEGESRNARVPQRNGRRAMACPALKY
jgi:hypothetical protein